MVPFLGEPSSDGWPTAFDCIPSLCKLALARFDQGFPSKRFGGNYFGLRADVC